MHTALNKPTFLETLPAKVARGLEDLSATREALLARMSQSAATKGTVSAWDWIEAHVGRSFNKPVRAMIEDVIVCWLQLRPRNTHRKSGKDHPIARLVEVRKAADSLVNAIAALESDKSYYLPIGDDMWREERVTLDLVPRLLALVDVLRPYNAKRSSLKADKMLISTLKDVFEREIGDRATTTPTGPFCRLLAAVWEILPTDQRCNSVESFVDYARLPERDKGDEDDEEAVVVDDVEPELIARVQRVLGYSLMSPASGSPKK